MILKEFYKEKKSAIEKEFSFNAPAVHLYTDTVFKNTIPLPTIMFKYDVISWETSSEKNYKADVAFCLYIIMPIGIVSSYEDVFDIACNIDKAILSTTNTNSFIDKHSTFKIKEKQYTNEDAYWEKNNYFIWEITYKTTLIENDLKKKYILFNNGLSTKALEDMGYNLTSEIIAINTEPIKESIDLRTT